MEPPPLSGRRRIREDEVQQREQQQQQQQQRQLDSLLAQACNDNDLDAATTLVTQGADLNALVDGKPALHRAIIAYAFFLSFRRFALEEYTVWSMPSPSMRDVDARTATQRRTPMRRNVQNELTARNLNRWRINIKKYH